MTLTRETNTSEITVAAIKEALLEKKAKKIAILDLRKLDHAICDYFIITHGTSDRHVQSLAENTVDEIHKAIHIKPWHVEGITNKEWILIDYSDVVVHVFQENIRDFYRLEDVWADADITYIEDEEDDLNNI